MDESEIYHHSGINKNTEITEDIICRIPHNHTLYAKWKGTAKIYNGQHWKVATPYIYDGKNWKVATPYIFDGTNWKTTV